MPALYKHAAKFDPIGYTNVFSLDEQALVATIRDRVADLTQSYLGTAYAQ